VPRRDVLSRKCGQRSRMSISSELPRIASSSILDPSHIVKKSADLGKPPATYSQI